MRKILIITLCLLSGLLASTSFAVETTVFGPKQYKKVTNKTESFNDSFSATSGGGTMIVKNGNESGSYRVSSAVITLNGQEIFGTQDFSTGVYLLESSIDLAANNSLTVELREGRRGDYVTVEIKQGTDRQTFMDQYQDQIPPGSTASYDPERFSLITGLVQDIDNIPVSGVAVTIHKHPEYGTATTNASGQFTIPVNGGGLTKVIYQKQGLISAQRKLRVSWNEITAAETVQMITQDTASTTLTFDGNPNTVVTHQSTPVTDTFGSRSSTIVFTGNNTAYEVDENGNTIRQLTTITARATEFTTPESMPAKLPPNSAYTYCAELSVDGAERVRFNLPVTQWVDNFLGFDVGMTAPVGYYDRDKGEWVPSDNGVVVKLLDTDSNGIVDALDSTGDNQPDDLNGNQSFSDEVTGLGDPVKYPPGSTFWRIEIDHFTPVDINWPIVPPSDAIEPNPDEEPTEDEQKEEDKDCKGLVNSFVEERSRIFHEDIPIPGTDLTLHYASNRVKGYKSVITIPASGDTVPASLKRIIVQAKVAGRSFEEVLDPLPNQKVDFVWDGLDHLGKQIIGTVPANIKVGFVYDGFYQIPEDFAQSFGQAGNGSTGVQARVEVTLWNSKQLNLKREAGTIAEGWTISSHHYMSSYLVKGNGTILTNSINGIETIAGTGVGGYGGDGGPATEAMFDLPEGIEFDAEGNLYIADYFNHRIRKIDRDGIVTTVAGNGQEGFGGDGRLATNAKLDNPHDIAFDTEGNLYIADMGNQRIRMVNKDGIIATIAGNGTGPCNGDGGPAVEAGMGSPRGIAFDTAGNLYIADWGCEIVRKVDQNGIITTVAGNGIMGYSGDGGPAAEARIRSPWDIAVDSLGNLYIADCYNQVVRKVDPSGIITTVAGNGVRGYSGDGGPATEAQLNYPVDVALDASGNLYISQLYNGCIRKVDQMGLITTVAGSGVGGYSGDGGPATEAQLNSPEGIAFNAMENLFVADTYNNRIRKVDVLGLNENIFAENSMGYVVSESGTHLSTIDLDTGINLHEFGYDLDNNLISITDRSNNQITIQRDGNGVPTAIVSPDGVTTTLTINANNHLTRITYPDSGYYDFTYTSGGLMTVETEPEGKETGLTILSTATEG